MPSKMSHPESDGERSSDVERPSKKHKGETSMKRMATSKRVDDHAATSPYADRSSSQDITAQTLEGGGEDFNSTVPISSAFGTFSPARPPVAHSSRGSFANHSTLGFPRNQPASSALARQWKKDRVQRHADSLAFFSRDQLQNRAELPESSINRQCDHALRLDCFEGTGSLVWLQAQCIEEQERESGGRWIMEGSTFGHTQIDGAGRERGQHRVLSSYDPLDSDDDWDDEDFEWDLVKEQHSLPHSSVSLTPYAHRTWNPCPLYEVVQYDFSPESRSRSPLPRGLARTPYAFPSGVATHFLDDFTPWTNYDKLKMSSTLSTPVRPSLHPCGACETIVLHYGDCYSSDGMDDRHGDEINLTVTLMETEAGLSFDEVHLAPIRICFPSLPTLPDHYFSTIAINEGTGHCWLGHQDGKVEYLDMLWWIDENYLTCPHFDEEDNEDHGSWCTCSMEPIEPEEVFPASEEHGAVTNVVAVGGCEAVVAFSNGSVVLLELGKRLKISKTRDFVGHVNEAARSDDGGTHHVEMTVHTASRLMAIRGSDGQVRVWHLDDPYPLNSAWHRPRLPGKVAAPLDLLPQSPMQQEETSSQQESSAVATPPDVEEDDNDDDDTWDRLATQKVEEESFAELQSKRLSSLHASSFCSMTWTSTSWLADRDGQWEMSRQFNDEGRPKVVSAGPLPGLVVCSDRPAGTTFLYFEPGRGGVEDVEEESTRRDCGLRGR